MRIVHATIAITLVICGILAAQTYPCITSPQMISDLNPASTACTLIPLTVGGFTETQTFQSICGYNAAPVNLSVNGNGVCHGGGGCGITNCAPIFTSHIQSVTPATNPASAQIYVNEQDGISVQIGTIPLTNTPIVACANAPVPSMPSAVSSSCACVGGH
jgi:hypothetical protein